MCLAQGLQRSDSGEARTCGPSVSSLLNKLEMNKKHFDHGDVAHIFEFLM